MGEARPLSQKSSLPLSLCSNALLPSDIMVAMCTMVMYFSYKRTCGYESKQTDFEKDFSPVLLPFLVS